MRKKILNDFCWPFDLEPTDKGYKPISPEGDSWQVWKGEEVKVVSDYPLAIGHDAKPAVQIEHTDEAGHTRKGWVYLAELE